MMPSGKKQNQPTFDEIKIFRSVDEINGAIQKLKRRVVEVQGLKGLRYDDQRNKNATQGIRTTILEIFGPNSPEYGAHKYHEIYYRGVVESLGLRGPQGLQAGFEAGIPQTLAMLEGLVGRLDENLADLQIDPGARARSAFESMDLHPRIANACSDLYRDGHCKQAVLEASIALVNYVKERSRQHSLDGSKLMTTVFSANNPLLAFNELKDNTDKDEQEGFMHLFMGAVLALRNPRAHALFDDSPEMALDYIAFLSMLARRLDGARRI
jgi:uncharacterized protein (TIGR02391 family)